MLSGIRYYRFSDSAEGTSEAYFPGPSPSMGGAGTRPAENWESTRESAKFAAMNWPPAPVPSSLSALGRATDLNSSPAGGRTTHGSGPSTTDVSLRGPAGQALVTPVGGTTLLSASEVRAELARAESQGLLPVTVASPGPAGRGRLALTL